MTIDVLVVGAGPTGLMLAGWLRRLGVSVAVVGGKQGVVAESRALAVHARSLETYDQLGICEDALSRGRIAEGISVWVRGQRRASIQLGRIGQGASPHPYVYILSQNENEEILLAHLQRHGGSVQWQHRLVGLREDGEGVLATLETPHGAMEMAARYVCGCDGASSAVRHLLGMEFPGGTYAEDFYVADVQAQGHLQDGHVNVCLDSSGFQLTFPMRGDNRVRLVGTMPPDCRGRAGVQFQDIEREAARPFGIEVTRTTWFSSYRVHHRVAPHFRLGRCFLLGDAAHVHSPVGGQGMNTGLMDASNLGWKLAAVIRRGASERLLDTYAEERIPFAMRLVNTTDRAFTLITSRAPWAPFLRTVLFPAALRLFSRSRWVGRRMFRVVSQISIHYRGSWTSVQKALPGKVRAGDRLPWVSPDGGPGNFAALQSCDWQAHVYGDPDAELRAWPGLPVHSFPYDEAAQRARLQRDAVYLIRPDGYIGMVCAPFSSTAVEAYLQERGGLPAAEGL
jgi:2-polyprenyl-6-methoxyphenol hydroxylase-like FAD-dependent oxidoreductase